MSRHAFYCCSLRIGVIFIGAISIVMALLGLAAVCVVANRQTANLLGDSRRPARPPPIPAPDTEFVRVPRRSPLAHDTTEQFGKLSLHIMDSISLPLTDEGHRNEDTHHDASDKIHHQTEIIKKNGSEEPNTEGRGLVEESTQEVETDTRSSQRDWFAETSTETNAAGKQPGGDETSANSVDSRQKTSKPAGTQSSTEISLGMTSLPNSPVTSSENLLVASPSRRIGDKSTGRELEEEEGKIDDENWKENSKSESCGGRDLEDLIFKVSLFTAYETVEESRGAWRRAQGGVALAVALYALGLATLLAAGVLQVLHLGAAVLLVVGAAKGSARLVRPWRVLAVASWALCLGGHTVTAAAFQPLWVLNDALAHRMVFANAVATVLLLAYLAMYAYFYTVVLNFERQIRSKKQEPSAGIIDPMEKEQGNIYSCRF